MEVNNKMTKKDYGFVVGEYCRHRNNPEYGWVKILEIGYFGKTYKITRCEWSINKHPNFGLIKHFALKDLIKVKV